MYIEGDSTLYRLKSGILNVVSLLFKTLSWVNLKTRSLHKRSFPQAYIVSIDNLSFGGTGKTTLVLAIGEFLQQRGISFAIAMRGYRSKKEKESKSTRVERHHSALDVGDEALIFKRRFPDRDIYVGRDRVDSIEQAIAAGNTFILLDDGFQSTHIVKNMKIMLLNPQHPYYYLRNFKRLMKDEDIILSYLPRQSNRSRQEAGVAKDDELPGGNAYRGGYHFEMSGFCDGQGRKVEPDGAKIIAFSALGDNNRFREDLQHSSQVELVEFKGFNDHHSYSGIELEDLEQLRKKQQAQYLVCTEKDFMKILPLKLHHIPFLYAQNSIKFNFNLMSRLLDHAKKENNV